MNQKRISILGDGGWGTALALVLARQDIPSTIWGPSPEYLTELETTRHNRKFLPHISTPLPAEISFDPNLRRVVETSDILIITIPTAYLRSVLEKVRDLSFKDTRIVSCTKGIEKVTFLTPSRIIQDVLNVSGCIALSGPSHAEEVAHNIPTCVVAASSDREMGQEVQNLFMEKRFRVYTSDDVLGVELGGALKNIIAIAAGICDGLSFGSNTKAALLSRGLQEIVRFGVALGARTETFFGLSGMGDLVTTCISQYGRNRALGERIARGEKLDTIVSSTEMVAEGVYSTLSAYDQGRKLKIEMPITREVYNVLYENKDPLESISDLMLRDSKDEMTFRAD